MQQRGVPTYRHVVRRSGFRTAVLFIYTWSREYTTIDFCSKELDSALPESDDIASADENEQTADHPTEEEGPLHCEVDKVAKGKSSSQKERSKISDKMKMRVPKRRIVLSDPFVPITDLSAVKNRDEGRVEECKNMKLAKFENAKGRKQSSLKAKAETPAQKSRKRQNAGCTGCAMDASENCSKMTHGNDRTGRSTCPSNKAKRRGRLPKAQSRRLSERTNLPLVEKHEGVNPGLRLEVRLVNHLRRRVVLVCRIRRTVITVSQRSAQENEDRAELIRCD
uniref:Uncharacterized protein n=1 Tax=Trichuris muris TaxID=70415 RepID=A0A5S6QBM1_TRIMR